MPIKDSEFVAGNPPQAATKPPKRGRGKAPMSNAANSAKPKNPGGLNILKKVSQDGTFKTGLSK